MTKKLLPEPVKDLTPVSEQDLSAAKKRVEWMISFLIVQYHFVHQILGMMTKSPAIGLGTMGVRVISGGRFELHYDPVFVLKLKDEYLTYVLYHEVLHLALHHCTSRKFDNHLMGNYATDLAVNELIPVKSGSCEIPLDEKGETMGLLVSKLKKQKEYADIEEKKSAEWYYDYLRRKMKEQPCGGDCSKCKKGKGDEGEGKSTCLGGSMDDHGGWKEDEIADGRVRAKISEIAKNNQWGNVSSVEQEVIMAAQVKKVNWRNLLRQFYGNQVWNTRESTRKRPNRRTGFIHPGSKKTMVDKHLVAIDTSGSVDAELLSQFLAVLNQMVDYVPIDVMQFDCSKTEDPRPYDRRRVEFTFKGRGGTDFTPVMDMANERHYKSVVILTDGCASAPAQPQARVVWVLPVGCKPPVDWGLRVHMDKYA